MPTTLPPITLRPSSTEYSYAAQPQPLNTTKRTTQQQPTKPKYRQPYQDEEKINTSEQLQSTIRRPVAQIMHDPRVRRGTNFPPAAVKQQQIQQQQQMAQTLKRQHHTPTSPQPRPIEFMRVSTPEPVTGRKHTDVQTEAYIEDLRLKQQKVDMETQYQSELDHESQRLFVPVKHGVDASTVITTADSDTVLLDFALHVQPLVNVLVQKTLEQSLVEVNEEIEAVAIQQQLDVYNRIRLEAASEVQRLQRIDDARKAERERTALELQKRQLDLQRIKQQREDNLEVYHVMNEVTDAVIEKLEQLGYFYDPLRREIEQVVLPQIVQQVELQLQQFSITQQVVEQCLRDAISESATEIEEQHQQRRTDDTAIARQVLLHTNQRAQLSALSMAERHMELVEQHQLIMTNHPTSDLVEDVELADVLAIQAEQRRVIAEKAKYLADVILIQCLARGKAARKRVGALLASSRLKAAREAMSPSDLVKSLKPSLHCSYTDAANDASTIVKVTSVDTYGVAAHASVSMNDAITSLDNQPIICAEQLTELITALKVGEIVQIQLVRALDGRTETLHIEVGTSETDEHPQDQIRVLRQDDSSNFNMNPLFTDAETAEEHIRDHLTADVGLELQFVKESGMVVRRILPEAEHLRSSGVVEGAVLTNIDEQTIKNTKDVTNLIKTHLPGDRVKLTVTLPTLPVTAADSESSSVESSTPAATSLELSIELLSLQHTREQVRAWRRMAKMAVYEDEQG